MLAKILTDEVPAPARARPSVPSNVDAAIRRALEKVPADRFRHAQDFGNALTDSAFRHGEAAGTAGVAARWNRLTVGMAILIAALSISLAAVLLKGRSADPESGVMRLSLDLGELVHDRASDVSISPDGTLFAVAVELDGQRALYIRSTQEDRFRRMPGTEGARSPKFSPDGGWIVFRDVRGQLVKKVSVDGGSPLTVVGSGLTGPLPAHWLDDGTILLRADNAMYRVSEDGGAPEMVTPMNGLSNSMYGLPGGRAVLFTRGSRVFLYNVELDSTSLLLTEAVDPMYVETGHVLFGHPDGGLFGVAFDADELALQGQPKPLMNDLWVRGSNAHFALAGNGTLVYGSGKSGVTEWRLRIVDFEGGTEPLPIDPEGVSTPRWSPDGRSIAYSAIESGSRQIFVYDLDGGGEPRQVTFEGPNRHPTWSPDGERIAYQSGRVGSRSDDLFVTNLRGNSPDVAVLPAEGYQSPRQWIADQGVLYEGGANPGVTDLWRLPPEPGAEAVPYLQSEADLDDISVSPDQAWAAYQSNQVDTEEVYVNSYPDPGRAVRVTHGGGQYPRWSPDGSTLYYWTSDGLPVDTLYAAKVVTSPTFQVVSRSIVSYGPYDPEDWDLHPSGDRFVVTARMDRAPAAEVPEERFIVVLNFLQELQRLVPR